MKYIGEIISLGVAFSWTIAALARNVVGAVISVVGVSLLFLLYASIRVNRHL